MIIIKSATVWKRLHLGERIPSSAENLRRQLASADCV